MSRSVVAVTGATGFLGRHIVAALLQAGARPRVLARSQPAPGFDPAVEILRGDLRDAAALAALVRGAAAVVHVAGLIKAPNAAGFMRINRDATRGLAEIVRAIAPQARFVLISSLAARAPFLSAYAASKRAGEAAVTAAYAPAAEQLVVLRPPIIYGPGDRETLAIFKAAGLGVAVGAGAGRFALIYAPDAAGTIARLAGGRGAAGLYELADDRPEGYAMAEIQAAAARALGRPPPKFIPVPAPALLLAGHVADAVAKLRRRPAVFSAGKAREMLHPDWSVHARAALPADIRRPRTDLETGFAATVSWYRAHSWLR